MLKQLTVQDYLDGIKAGNIAVLSKAITLVESTLPAHQELAEQIIAQCLPLTGNSMRIGITGVPGVGKSSFIEKFGVYLADAHSRKVAVLAIDPTSSISGGSILGDKTRMERLSVHPHAFIRPTPSSNALGGVARKTRETIYLCEAAGFDAIIVETVGVGQSETAVHSMVDFFLLLMLSGAGDELQGIKRGIMEMADALVITKADGTNKDKAKLAAIEYKRAMHLLPPHAAGWIPETTTCSSLTGEGMNTVWGIIEKYKNHTTLNHYFSGKRKKQAVYWMDETIHENIKQLFFSNPQVKIAYDEYVQQLNEGSITSYKAAKELMKLFGEVRH
ncbi:MAG: methylmalonyl Co-A mutase-associated GTPase MeaB [Bacteroidota bacterium]